MAERGLERALLVANYHEGHDVLVEASTKYDIYGVSDCDLRCGQDSVIILRNFSIQEAQHFFGREGKRVLTRCPTCHSYNLLAAALQKLKDGSFITLPGGELGVEET